MDQILILLAILQGLFEWWPISSSGVIVLVSLLFNISISESYVTGLSLHLASGLAVFTIYRREIYRIIDETFHLDLGRYSKGYILSVATSFLVGYPIYVSFLNLSSLYGSLALLLISIGLFITTLVLLRSRRGKGLEEISLFDWIITGLLQGLAVLPGFSRSGLTIGYLCIRGYDPYKAVEASLLLAVPVLIMAGIYNLLNTNIDLYGLVIAQTIVFIISILSAKILITVSRRLKIYYFTFLLALITLFGALIDLFIH